ncbi:nuclear transport factor 2 family protein [Spirilliplanes yamanashiensis]|uniref:SnoaL-like domain-containing protein n=1 Tax=Spirilliplanes yamanashiensis TaxID=42233 RepID=A0A8J4DJQ2_9ACTN|nr:nuclear transport factor 2 family protein [Spirilliplanes yamanashiensis]MDP9816866.1 limonene-1,2-epoxide hydrolase [Spirilliplanes yamanashiensis]GIJ03478.1 hypothetical protein Sya03_28300 [Spirilliplanes yamanashiensis]
MSPTPADLAEAFSRHRFDVVHPHLADDVRWEIVGDRELLGRDAVIAACDATTAGLAGVRTVFQDFRVAAGDGFVVVDSRAEYTGDDEPAARVASCDVYRFAGETLVEITSYTVAV